MLFAAYALFLLITSLALVSIAGGGRPRREGSAWRPITIAVALAFLLVFVMLVPQQEGFTSVGTLLVTAGIVGSGLYAIGAASWTGVSAFWLRTAGWLLTAAAVATPSTLTLVLPLVAVLAFAVVPISRYAVVTEQPGGLAA